MSELQYDDINIANLVDPNIDTMSRQMAQYLIDMIKIWHKIFTFLSSGLFDILYTALLQNTLTAAILLKGHVYLSLLNHCGSNKNQSWA